MKFSQISTFSILFRLALVQNSLTMSNMSLFDINATFDKEVEPLDCPNLTKLQLRVINDDLVFWVDFVVDGALAAIGLIANIVSALILGK